MNLSKALECPLTIGLWLAAPVIVGVRRDMLVRDMLIGTEDCKNLDSVFLKLRKQRTLFYDNYRSNKQSWFADIGYTRVDVKHNNIFSPRVYRVESEHRAHVWLHLSQRMLSRS